MPLSNCKVELKLKWTKYCVLSSLGTENDINDTAGVNNITFTFKHTKLYIPVVTLSARDNQKLSKLLSKGFEKSVYWNKYRIIRENRNTTNEFRYFLESNFVGINRLLFFSFMLIVKDLKLKYIIYEKV